MKLPIVSLFFTMILLAPLTAQAQRAPSSADVPKNLQVGGILSGTIMPKNPEKIAAMYGQVKCSDLKVTLQESNPSNVIVQVPGQPQKSKFPDSYAPVTVQTTGNHLGLGCKFALSVPTNAGQGGYLVLQTPAGLSASPSGWQNPMPFPMAGFLVDNGRNFVVDVVTIK